MIETDLIKQKIIYVLKQIQEAGDFKEVEIATDSCPGKVLTEFDSQLWVVANTMLGEEIADSIPDNVNIFVSEDGKRPLSIDEISERIAKNLKKGGKE